MYLEIQSCHEFIATSEFHTTLAKLPKKATTFKGPYIFYITLVETHDFHLFATRSVVITSLPITVSSINFQLVNT